MNDTSASFNDFVRSYTSPSRILVVEDEKSVAHVMRGLLNQYDVEVTICERGHDANDAMKEGQFDLIFADLVLPDMHYSDLARAIEHLQPLAPVVIISGFLDDRAMTALNAILQRPVWYMEKPFTLPPERLARLFQTLRIRAPYKGKSRALKFSFVQPHIVN